MITAGMNCPGCVAVFMAEMNFVPYEELASYYEEDHDAYYDVRESIADAERRCQLPCAKIQENDEERGADHNERIEICQP